jgi:dynein intermediate chain 2
MACDTASLLAGTCCSTAVGVCVVCCREKGSETLLGGVSLEYDPAAGPTKFMVGCEQGSVLSCNRKAKNPADRVGSSYVGHHGPVYGLKR